MTYRKQQNERGEIIGYTNTETGESISAKDFEKQMQMQQLNAPSRQQMSAPMQMPMQPHMNYQQPAAGSHQVMIPGQGLYQATDGVNPRIPVGMGQSPAPSQGFSFGAQPVMPSINPHTSPLVQPGATLLTPQSGNTVPGAPQPASQGAFPGTMVSGHHPANATPTTMDPSQGMPPSAGAKVQGKNLRLEGIPHAHTQQHSAGHLKR